MNLILTRLDFVTVETRSFNIFGKTYNNLETNIKINNLEVITDAIVNGDIGIAESFMEAKWETDNLTNLLEIAISNPRLHLEGNTLFYEPNIEIPKHKLKNIILNSFDNKNLFFGGVNAVSQTDAIGDNRRGGCGLIV